jgi:predicted alpha/beta-hydrolase family hydrolase
VKVERWSIPVRDIGEVSAVLSVRERGKTTKGTGVILAHGAGNDMNTPLFLFLSNGLAEAGYPTLRFNFLYREKGKKAPDKEDILSLTWQSVFQYFKAHPSYEPGAIIAAGKSMGGRIASRMVAEGRLEASGLILLGYPLHPPGKPNRLRDAHLYQIGIPMLFLAGTRDALCDLRKLEGVIRRITSPCGLEIVEGGDHSFNVPKSLGIKQEVVYHGILGRTLNWIGARFET